MSGFEIDESDPFGARAAAHLRDEIVGSLTSVTRRRASRSPGRCGSCGRRECADGLQPGGGRAGRTLGANPRVTLNFGGDGRGGDIVVLSGRARVYETLPPADGNEAYLVKYADHVARISMTPQSFAERYSVPLRIELTALDGNSEAGRSRGRPWPLGPVTGLRPVSSGSSSTMSSVLASGSRNQNIGGTGSPKRETSASTSTPRRPQLGVGRVDVVGGQADAGLHADRVPSGGGASAMPVVPVGG